ncbi:MAG: hypothetical protein RR137_05515 [Odoribacter sp.]
MQFVKWFILFLVFSSFAAGECQGAISIDVQAMQTSSSWQIRNTKEDEGHNLLRSFISILFVNAGDLTDENGHHTYDKKSYPRIFVHFRYNDMHSQIYEPNVFSDNHFLFARPSQIDCYVYALKKIII